MDPNNQQSYQPEQQVYSIDYLDQIAPKKPQRSGPKMIMLIIGGGIVFLLVLTVLGLIFSSGSKSSGQTAIDLHARLDTLKTIAKAQQPDLRDNVLRNNNSALTLQLTNASADLKAALEAEGVKTGGKQTKELKAEQQALSNQLTSEFEEAGLNMQLDRTYAREMAYQLDVIGSMITTVAKKTGNPLIQSFVENNDSNLKTIAKSLNTFDGAK